MKNGSMHTQAHAACRKCGTNTYSTELKIFGLHLVPAICFVLKNGKTAGSTICILALFRGPIARSGQVMRQGGLDWRG